MLLPAPEVEARRHGFHHPGALTVEAVLRCLGVEARPQGRIPPDVVAVLHLVVEEAGEEQALGTGSLHDLGIGVLAAVQDEQVSRDRPEPGRTRREVGL